MLCYDNKLLYNNGKLSLPNEEKVTCQNSNLFLWTVFCHKNKLLRYNVKCFTYYMINRK